MERCCLHPACDKVEVANPADKGPPLGISAMRLSTELLLSAYCQGVFPMANSDGDIYWYDPDPRAILPLDAFHVPRRLLRTIKGSPFDVRFNTAFRRVVRACAEPAPGRPETWINAEMTEAYVRLHERGYAHSVETWLNGDLVGGLYGVAIRGFFAGESMFKRVGNASKIALYHLVRRLKAGGFQLLDVQFMTEHLRAFGSKEITRDEYRRRLARALAVPARFSPHGGAK
jgi:leucyl/phenylalanyl-tRNA--protein transferase